MPVPKLYEGKEPEWTDEKIFRESGDTTFKKCGWCEHTTSGIVKYNCMLRSYCGLMGKHSPEFDWNDDCRYKKLSKGEKLEIVKDKLYDIDVIAKRITREEGYIYIILNDIERW